MPASCQFCTSRSTACWTVVSRPLLIAEQTFRDCSETADLPYGEYLRSAPYGMLEGNFLVNGKLGQVCEGFVEIVARQHLRAVTNHFRRPRERRIGRDRFHQKEKSPEPQGLPALVQRSAFLSC